MDLLKSPTFFTASELQRSQLPEGRSANALAGFQVENEGGVEGQGACHAVTSRPIESMEGAEGKSAPIDQAEEMIMLQIWSGNAEDKQNLTPKVGVPPLEDGIALVDARNVLSNYVLSAFQ